MPKSLVPNQFDYAGIYVEGKRSQFRFHKGYLGSFMSGMLVPLGDPIPVFPGTKLDLKINAVIRSNTMVVPPLDGIYVDFFAVWVPHRIVWTNFPQFLGENDTTAWTQSNALVYPAVAYQVLASGLQSLIADSSIQGDVVAANNMLLIHYGFGNKTAINTTQAIYNKQISVLGIRGYYSLWNHFFRDENYQRPVLFSKTNSGSSGEYGYLVRDYDAASGAKISSKLSLTVGVGTSESKALLMPVNKFHDAFTSLLPQAQYGNSVMLPLGTSAPVMAAATTHDMGDPILFNNGNTIGKNLVIGAPNSEGNGVFGMEINSTIQGIQTSDYIRKSNLVADLTAATAVTINQLRSSVMYQRFLEALARGGRRVPEYYEAIYGVKNTAAAKDYPVMLSHSRYMLGVNQVVATADASGSGWTSHLGDTGAFSLTNLRGIPCCEKEFTEFGYLHILYCVRADNRYSQAIPEHFFRSSLLDEYNPFFDHIGDTPVPNYLVISDASTESNFGFQEAWWSERTQISICCGALNKAYGSLSYWTLSEYLDPTLTTCTPGYLCFAPEVFNDVFVSAYYAYPQFIMDALIFGKKAARMSQHSIPGIVGRI